MASSSGNVVDTKEVFNKPKGNLLNDNDSGVDYLQHSVYADALALTIQNVPTPITIGILGSWGSGKSFLLKLIKHKLLHYQRETNKENENDHKKDEKKISSQSMHRNAPNYQHIKKFLQIVALVVACFLFPILFFCIIQNIQVFPEFIVQCFYSMVSQCIWLATSPFRRVLSLILGSTCLMGICISGFVAILLIFKVWKNENVWSAINNSLLLFVAFTKLPIKTADYSNMQDLNKSYKELMINAKSRKQRQQKNSFIFVNFNAWEYAGSDDLWAAIVTTMSNAIEQKFGIVTSRLFHMFNVETIPTDSMTENTKLFVHFPISNEKDKEKLREIMAHYGIVKCCVTYKEWLEKEEREERDDSDNLMKHWWVVEFANTLEAEEAQKHLQFRKIEVKFSEPIVHTIQNPGDEVANRLEARSFWKQFQQYPKKTFNVQNFYWIIILFVLVAFLFFVVIMFPTLRCLFDKDLDYYTKIISSTPAIATILSLVGIYKTIFKSQTKRILSALEGTTTNMADKLGFMHEVKTEVDYITSMIKCAEYIEDVQYKVVIFIDDLDRIPLSKVKSVFEAISILLSDPSSPFVCLIAVDPRIAIKSIEDNMTSDLLLSGVSGHEYLKKIINLPFCLPEIPYDTNKKYLVGLFDLPDQTKSKPESKKPVNTSTSDSTQSKASKQNGDDFLSSTRKYLLDKDNILHKYLSRNPRDIKRIYNVLTLTSWTIYCYEKQEQRENFLDIQSSSTNLENPQSGNKIIKFAQSLLHWIVLADQWPREVNLILQAIENDKRKSQLPGGIRKIDKETHLFQIYKDHAKQEVSHDQVDDMATIQIPNSKETNLDKVYCYLSDLNDAKVRIDEETIDKFKPFIVSFHQNLHQTTLHEKN